MLYPVCCTDWFRNLWLCFWQLCFSSLRDEIMNIYLLGLLKSDNLSELTIQVLLPINCWPVPCSVWDIFRALCQTHKRPFLSTWCISTWIHECMLVNVFVTEGLAAPMMLISALFCVCSREVSWPYNIFFPVFIVYFKSLLPMKYISDPSPASLISCLLVFNAWILTLSSF